jgi:WD40 repeat protein
MYEVVETYSAQQKGKGRYHRRSLTDIIRQARNMSGYFRNWPQIAAGQNTKHMVRHLHSHPPIMTRRYNLAIALLLLTAVLSACGGDSTAPPTTGTIEFNVVTTGVDIDADGFLLTVDGGSGQAIPANGTLSLSSLPGNHPLTISGLAFNCDVNAPASVSVVVGQAARVDVRASCTPYLRNAIVYVTDQFGFGEVMVMRPDGSRTERLTIDQVAYSAPAVSPDGQTIAVASYLGGGWNGIYLLDRFGKGRTTLVSNSAGEGSPAWSPDGTRIAFVGILHGPYGDYGRIFIVNRDGSGLRQVTPEVAATDYKFDSGASWSPDGTRLVFSRMGVLFFINADGTGLVSTGVSGDNPAWSPDGTQIAYGSLNGGNDGLWVMNASLTSRRLTTAVQQDEFPSWSPDGLHLVFQRVENNLSHLYTINADGSGATRLGNVQQNEDGPNWSRNF